MFSLFLDLQKLILIRILAEPVKATRVIEYSNRICLSKQPVSECPKNSYEQVKQTKRVDVSKLTILLRN